MKIWRIIQNTLLGIIGLVLLLLVAFQILMRPSVLTGIVNRVAASLVEGDVAFEEVRAHAIKSFPYLDIEAKALTVTYPHQRYARFDSVYTQSGRRMNLLRRGYGRDGLVDTLATAGELRLSLNYMALARGDYHVHKAELVRPRIYAHYYDSTAANWDILPLGGGPSAAKDTSGKALPSIRIDQIGLSNRAMVIYTNPVDTLHAMFSMRRFSLEGNINLEDLFQTHASVSVDSMRISGRLPQDTLSVRLESLRLKADNRRLQARADASTRLYTGSFGRLQLPVVLDVDATFPERDDNALEVVLHALQLQVSALALEGKGSLVKHPGWWDMDVEAAVRDCPLGDLMKEYRENLTFLKKLDTDARISLEASARGSYGAGRTPVVNARLLVPPAHLDYEGLGREGRLAVDARITTDNLQEIDATVERLLVDIAGAHIDVTGKALDVLGKDPRMQLSGNARARLDSLTRIFTAGLGLSGTGSLDVDLRARTRLSQLSLAGIGKADIDCDIRGRNLSLDYAPEKLTAQLPVLDLNVATRDNTIDRNLARGARVLGLKADIDTLDVTYGDMFIRGGRLNLLMQPSADILQGRNEQSSIMGLLRVNNLRMRDGDGMSVGVKESTERFRLEPATARRPVPRLTVGSRNGRLRVRMGSDVFSLRGVNLEAAALRHQVRRPSAQRQTRILDSLQRIYPEVPRDSLLRLSLRQRMAQASRDEFASADLSISLSDAVKRYFREWDVEGQVDVESGRMLLPAFPLRTGVSGVSGTFDNDTLELRSITLTAGASDITAGARLTGLRRAVVGRSGRGRFKLDANVSSNQLDVNELLRAFAYYSNYEPAQLEGASDEDVEAAATQAVLPDSVERAQLIIVPSNLEMDFSLEANRILYDSLEVSWASADVAMRDRTVQITNALAATNMGDMYLEGFYSTRSKREIKAGFDLNLANITAEKVITLFPAVDTLLPMLTSFAGDLDCELAATADIDTCMNLILPSIDGVLRISGKDLTLKGGEEFSRLAGKLMFYDQSKAHIDHMSVAGILQDNTLEIFPFVLDVDRYQLAASGHQYLDKDFLYHISVIKSPMVLKFGVNAWGPDFDNVHYSLTSAKYRSANVPVYTKELESVKFNLVSAIHNIFELGADKALARNRDAAGSVSARAREEEVLSQEEASAAEGLSGLSERVTRSVSTRREALRKEILRLQEEAQHHDEQ